MGDAGISSSSLQTFFDAFGFHANFLRLLVDNQAKGCTDQPTTTIYHACAAPSNAGGMGSAAWFNGSVPDVTPFSTGPYGANPGSTDWQTAFPVVARNLLLHYGPVLSKPLLTEIWPSLELFMTYLDRLISHSTQVSCHDIAAIDLGCILLKMAAISLRTGLAAAAARRSARGLDPARGQHGRAVSHAHQADFGFLAHALRWLHGRDRNRHR